MKSRVKPTRSPASLRTPTTTTTPSQFFPPSYFAAAAGVPYPHNRDETTNQHEPQAYQEGYSFSPNASYLVSPRARRKSQLGELECQLLPTLSDTVERMTRPPSQVVQNAPSSSGSGASCSPGVARTPSKSSHSSSSSSETSAHLAIPPTIPVPPKQLAALRSPSTDPPRSSSSSRPPNPKSILKSSHTTFDRHVHARTTHLEDTRPGTEHGRKASRNPIPIPPEPLPSEGRIDHVRPTPVSPRPKTDGPLRTSRARSRTDPGTKGLASIHAKNTVLPDLPPSGIPRRVGIPTSPATPRMATPAPMSSTDVAISCNTRRPFVTNAEMASSSSSDSHAPLGRPVKPKAASRTDSQSSAEMQLRPPRFGLGLGLSGTHEPKYTARSSPGQQWTSKMVGLDDRVHSPSRKKHSREGMPKRHDRSPPSHAWVNHTDQQRRHRALLVHIPADGESQPSGSEGSDDLCLASDGSGESLRSAFDDSGSEYSPPEEQGWEATLEQARCRRTPRQSQHVGEQYTPRPSSGSPYYRQSKRQMRSCQATVASEDEPCTLASDEDVSSTNDTVIQTPPQRYSSELSRLMAISMAAAAQQRQAFGIRTSLERTDHEANPSEFPHTDSEVSLIKADRWQDECDELPTGSLLQRQYLTGDADSEYDERRSSTGELSVSSLKTKSSMSQESIYSTPNSPLRRLSRSIVVPEFLSTTSTVRDVEWQTLERRVLDAYGEVEARRQRFIWEVTESEEAFVAQLQNMLHLFILPLRVKDTRMWVSGIPSDVTNLFDWLDDIVRVHARLSSTLAARQTVDNRRLQLISEVFRTFVPRLETYQPYLVKLEFTASMIDTLVHEGKNDFGDFIKLQEAHERCQGWSLEQYLIEPVNRLAQYPEVFRRLLQLTPKSHPDYMSTLSLFHAAKLTIRVLSEVKDREDAYELVKMACSGIRGISIAHLVHRERRLLIRGSLTCVQVSDDEQASSLEPIGECDQVSRPEVGPRARRTDQLTKAIHIWRGRSNSIKSSASTVVSFSTAPSSFDVHVGQRLPMVRVESEPMDVEVMVFTDLVLLASRVGDADGGNGVDEACDLEPLEGFGLARVVSVLDEIDHHGYITLDLAPLTEHALEEGYVQSTGSVVTIALSRPPAQHARVGDSSASERPRHGSPPLSDWLAPLRRSGFHTHRALASPSMTHALVNRAKASAVAVPQPVLSLLAAGLPLPKSPSMQMEESARGIRGIESERLEREERGWWSTRFHEVFAELSAQEAAG